MSTLIITRGLPASGKTTYAQGWVFEDPENRARVNRDDLRQMLFGKYTGLTFQQEEAITKASRQLCKELLKAGKDVIADDMNLRPKYVREWERFARANGFGFKVEEFECSIEASKIRNAHRKLSGERYVPADAIEKMRKFLGKGETLQPVVFAPEESVAADVYVPDRMLEPAVIVDIDGTVALMDGRSPYDLSKVHTDRGNRAVIEVVWALEDAGNKVIFLSGREETARKETEEWLNRHVCPGGELTLFMRPEGDHRKDAIVKRELFDKYVRPNWCVTTVLDDRNQVVEMWRGLGLTCLQVAPGDF